MSADLLIIAEDQRPYVSSFRAQIEADRQGGASAVPRINALGAQFQAEFAQAEQDRQEIEQRWLMDLRQYRGIYEPDVEAKLANRSKAFLRKTRVKVKTVDARLMDLLFPANRERNYVMEASPEPTITDLQRARLVNALRQTLQAEPSADQMRQAVKNYVDAAAKRMASTIDDQLVQARYRKLARAVLHDGNLYGTGVLKGPLVDVRTKPRYVSTGNGWAITDEVIRLPFVDHVPLWRWYPDMAATEIEHCRYVWERPVLTKAELVKLASNPTFDRDAILRHVAALPMGQVSPRSWESEVRILGKRQTAAYRDTGLYELAERWGWIDRDALCGCDQDQARKFGTVERGVPIVFGNVWMLPSGELVKTSIQPIKGQLYPYHAYYFDKDETSIFGEGLASIMRDDQTMLNASVRALLDNLAITAGPQIEVMVSQMHPQTDMQSVFPFKVWPRVSGDAQYPALRVHNVDSHIRDLGATAAMFSENADETTAIPRYTYGENPTQGAAATMGGLSMLLGQANLALKDQVSAWDEGITAPFIGGLKAWNMQFNPDPSVKGDFDHRATGASSLVAKEVRGQLLAQYSASLQPEERMYVKWHELAVQKAEAMDLDGVVMDKDEAEREANSPMAQMQQQLQMASMQAQVELLLANLGKVQTQIREIAARASGLEAAAVKTRVETTYNAMQAAGVAASNPVIAPAGDELLRSSGWQDATPETPIAAAVPAQSVPSQVPESPPTAGVGQAAGIETAQIPG